MDKIGHLSNCCGCKACSAICPKGAISFKIDIEGFQNPEVSDDLCVDCGLCEKVCPALSPFEKHYPLMDYGAYAKDEEIRRQSSSGGIFSLLSENIINKGGVVFGAAFCDDFSVKHISVESKEDLSKLRGSKYLQSDTNDTFIKCKAYLDSGRKVLYSGTPCQISGLKHFLRKDYENLLTVDIICHGVPSPEVWQRYLTGMKMNRLSLVSFRDKSQGWHNYHLLFSDGNTRLIVNHHDDIYMQLFLKNVILRPSCYDCPVKEGRSGSDITLGDFWGIEKIMPEMDDDKGTSIVMVNTKKGTDAFFSTACIKVPVLHTEAIQCNSCWHVSTDAHINRLRAFEQYRTKHFFQRKARQIISPKITLLKKIFIKLKKYL